MCFSATASFTSAAVLMTVGAATSAMNKDKSQKMFTAIPILFALQQAAEGLVWTTMGQDYAPYLQRMGVLAFLAFALVIWPSWVPWAVLKMETSPVRRKILMVFAAAGFITSLATAYALYTTYPTAFVTGKCMGYALPGLNRYNLPANVDFFMYFTPVVISFFVSSFRHVKITGALIMVGLAITNIVNKEASTSVWCFFAAIASVNIAWHVYSENKGRISLHFN